MRGALPFEKGSKAYQIYWRVSWVVLGAAFIVFACLAASRGNFGENRQGKIDFSAAQEPFRFWCAVVFMALAGLLGMVIGITKTTKDKAAPQQPADAAGHNH